MPSPPAGPPLGRAKAPPPLAGFPKGSPCAKAIAINRLQERLRVPTLDQPSEAGLADDYPLPADDYPLPADGSLFPYYIQQPHEVNPGFHFDWTICTDDWPREEALRQVHNKLLERQLREGLTVAYRQSGWSLYPRIYKNDLCYFKPTGYWGYDLRVGDVVFCAITSCDPWDAPEEVEPGFRYYTHQIKKIDWVYDTDYYVNTTPSDWVPHFTISDLKGRETGKCSADSIYGKLIFVEYK